MVGDADRGPSRAGGRRPRGATYAILAALAAVGIARAALATPLHGPVPPSVAPGNPLQIRPENRARFFHTRVWRLDEGLPQNSVTDLVQGPRGYLWLSTFGGLARFDGVRFEVWDPTRGLDRPRILSLELDREGRLWLGHERGGLTRFDPVDGSIASVSLPPALARRNIEALQMREGRPWLAAEGLAAVGTATAGWRYLAVDPEIRRIARTPDGTTWLGGPDYLARVPPGGPSEVVTRDLIVHRLAVSPDGHLWILHDHGLSVVVGDRVEPRLPSPTRHWRVSGPLFGADGALWLSVDRFVYRHPSFRDLARSADVESNRSATAFLAIGADTRALLEDREGNLWVGTQGEGLWRLSLEPFRRIGVEEGLLQSSAGAVLSDGAGGLWVANPCAGAFRVRDDRVVDRAFEARCILALARAPDGTLWGGSDDLLARRPDGEEQVHRIPDECRSISALVRTRDGALWMGTEEGCVLRRGGGRIERIPSPLRDRVNLIREAPDGALWFAETSRVLTLREGTWSSIGTEEGAPPGSIRALHHDGETVWLGSYGGGVSVVRSGRVERYDRARGLQDNFISHILDDGRGFMWFNSNQGAFRVPKRDFEEVRLGRQDRLRARLLATGEAEVGCPSGWFDGEEIAFPTIEGLVRIRLDRLGRRPVPPPTVIEAARVETTSLDPDGVTSVPAGSRRLEVRFSAPLLRWPRLASFEHRLEGVDHHWRRTQQRMVSYDGLTPGRYHFEVRAVNEEERRGEPARVAFRIEPHLYERPAFQLSAGALLLLGLIGGHRARTLSMRRHNRRLEAEVAQRERAERALRDRERHYRRVFESSVNAFFVEDAEGRIVDLNPAGSEMFGYTREALLGRPTRELFDPTQAASHPDCVTCVRRDGSTFEGRATRRRTGTTKDAQVLLTLTDLSPLIEARKQEQRLQAQLAHSQRVEAIGRLAGGVAHDVNNMLTVVKGQAKLAQEALREGDSAGVEDSLNDILASSERSGNLTRQLLALGRRKHVQPVDLDLRTHLSNLRRMLERLTPDDVVLRWSWPDRPCIVRIDPTQLEQVVVNLVINATQALPHGGTVEIGVARVRGEPGHLPPGAIDEGEWVDLWVEDDGVGMSEDVKARVFEPFYSTKPQGENTGLGLSVVHGIVTDAGGRYFVESTEGVGTRFDFLFPARGGDEAPPARREEGEGRPTGGTERVLYCEDEAPVRRTAGRILERAGYEVTICAHPFDALERARTADRPFDLLVTDVMMPDMNGPALAEAVRDRFPRQKVLFVSGYTSDLIADLDDRQDFIEKPFESGQLLGAVRRLLDAPDPPPEGDEDPSEPSSTPAR